MGSGDGMSWLVLVGGGLLLLLGVIKIMANSARLLIWLLVLLAGLAGLTQGLKSHPEVIDRVGLPAAWSDKIRDFVQQR
ncbi:MAG: hypothetical protein H7834_07395 [Magnetococcus sp. YQC-9]